MRVADHVSAFVAADHDVDEVFASLPRTHLRVALIGDGIGGSRSPRMHEREGRRLGLDYSYSLIDFDALHLSASALPAVCRMARQIGFAGLNVTHPFKQAIIPCLDALSPEAAAIGAVNTVVFRDGRAVGHNTDCWGFAESFRREMLPARLDRVLLLGAGGAGKAVANALLALGVGQIEIFDVDYERAESLAERLDAQTGRRSAVAVTDPARSAGANDGLINATPVGMAKYPGMPVPASSMRPDLWVADVVYVPVETELLRSARAAGCRTMSGKGMAIFQAVMAFQLITGATPDAGEMARHFEAGGPFDEDARDGQSLASTSAL